MEDGDPKSSASAGYAWAQWLKALASAGKTAAERAEKWREVLAGMASGTLQIGSRAPVEATPVWVTLDVVHGGFATGTWAAGGSLQPHEISKLELLGDELGLPARAGLNAYYLSPEGRAELAELSRSGRFRASVPEETALLVVAWLLERQEEKRSLRVLQAISPFFEQLRFYPEPRETAESDVQGVSVQTVGEVVETLREKKERPAVEAMREAVTLWGPLYDETVAMFLETVGEGGEPCRRFAPDWAQRAQRLLDRYERERARHQLCKKPDDPRENYHQLRNCMTRSVRDAQNVSDRDRKSVRRIVDAYVAKRGAPGSAAHAAARNAQYTHASRPSPPRDRAGCRQSARRAARGRWLRTDRGGAPAGSGRERRFG